MLDSLDTLIAFVLIMLVVSLLITIVVQMCAALLNLRGWNLLMGLRNYFRRNRTRHYQTSCQSVFCNQPRQQQREKEAREVHIKGRFAFRQRSSVVANNLAAYQRDSPG